uniref:Uncharacterized protein n=1 Tax=Mycena chlorophos TaxID=658473 RepID=A0ABQ0KX96_MYCCL|nr:predicted protein [Mycena chlorophos]
MGAEESARVEGFRQTQYETLGFDTPDAADENIVEIRVLRGGGLLPGEAGGTTTREDTYQGAYLVSFWVAEEVYGVIVVENAPKDGFRDVVEQPAALACSTQRGLIRYQVEDALYEVLGERGAVGVSHARRRKD